jgi:hypothetical protein
LNPSKKLESATNQKVFSTTEEDKKKWKDSKAKKLLQ